MVGALLRTIFGLGGGPVAWFTTAVGWVYSVIEWCFKHWKLVLSALAVAALFGAGFHFGAQHDNEKWQKRWDARDAADAAVKTAQAIADAEHEAVLQDRDASIDKIEHRAQVAEAARQAAYHYIQGMVNSYVEDHRNDTCGIGDDGLRIIIDAVRARRKGDGAAEGNGGGPP